MSWTYRQSDGSWLNPAGDFAAEGYSGQPPYVNVPSAEVLEGLGPIPAGGWAMTALELETPLHGPYVIVLEPNSETRARILAMGRDPDSFRIHGERLKPPPGLASDGCIILEHGVRVQAWESPDHELQVVP